MARVFFLPEEEYASLSIVNPFLKRLFKTDKTGIVDVRINTSSGRVIHVELQINKVKDMSKRLIYYAAKLLTEQIKIGQDWDKLHQIISIVICNHKLLPEERSYINSYEFRNEQTNRRFTDLVRFIILELPKLPEQEDGKVWPWLKLFTCTRRDHYEELVKQHPEVNMALSVLKEMSFFGQWRAYREARALQRADNAIYMRTLQEESIEQGLKKGLKKGLKQGLKQGLTQGRR
ncbi:MAG: Rpn family recombination-promoting nuclease/putative transposase [Treponema sp.]|jgi:predicted transposase/invertase (TIGR01784 family)|nr:Rpn family recombination-promoting nuclease/putative transposase [Treponema sp.]